MNGICLQVESSLVFDCGAFNCADYHQQAMIEAVICSEAANWHLVFGIYIIRLYMSSPWLVACGFDPLLGITGQTVKIVPIACLLSTQYSGLDFGG